MKLVPPQQTTNELDQSPQRDSRSHEPNPQPDSRSHIDPVPQEPLAEAESLPQPHAGTPRFGNYELIWELSRDALSTTWAAKRDGIDGIFALRIFNARVTDSAQIRNIKRAAERASTLTHLNHVTVYECGVSEEGAPYVVKECVDGETLAETFLVTKRFDIATFLNVFNQVCEGLVEAHSHQLVHGNLSPNKILLLHQDNAELETVKLIDFGMPADPVQNAFYLSPEQCLDRNRIDERSDIYSLGCIMYEALIGKPPFIGDQSNHASASYLHELASQYGKDTPEYNALKLLDCIIIKCLQKKPAKRFRNVRELMDALRMVSDCICNGSTRKLPRKAEKLLLFRFLSFFDRKIVVCMCAYLLLGMICQRYLGELQLQKSIDQAQFAGERHKADAIGHWKTAIAQAAASHKPPSLQAALHWELADALAHQEPFYIGKKNAERSNEVNAEAMKHYQKAYEYYKHGSSYRSYAFQLLNRMSSIWMQNEDPEKLDEQQEAARNDVRRLFEQGKYTQCAKDSVEYLKKFDDEEINYYAGSANYQIGLKLPPERALPYLQRAEHYFQESSSLDPGDSGLSDCLWKLGYVDSGDTMVALACKAIEAGDWAAAKGCFGHHSNGIGNEMSYAWQQLDSHYTDRYKRTVGKTQSKYAIAPLEQSLKLAEESFGKTDETLAATLSQLAECYADNGQELKAIECYKRVFKLQTDDFTFQGDLLNCVDLLVKNGKTAEARKMLEKQVRNSDGTYDINMQFIRLLQLYKAENMTSQLRHVLDMTAHVTEPTRFRINRGYVPISNADRYRVRYISDGEVQKGATGSPDPFSGP